MESTPSIPAAGQDSAAAALPVSFAGTPGGYWKVYITGLALSLATLGLYSPWAKLRRHRYLLVHTRLLGSCFEFDASPWAILISRIIILTIIIMSAWADTFYPFIDGEAVGLGTVVIMALLPAAIMRGRAFHARHTMFKGIRFRFASCYLHLYVYYGLVFLPLIAVLTLTYLSSASGEQPDMENFGYLTLVLAVWVLAMPAFAHFEHRILANNLHFGKLGLAISVPMRTYYAVAGRRLLMALALAALFALGLSTTGMEASVIALPAVLLALVWAAVLFKIDTARIFWSSLQLSDGSRIASRITFAGLLRVFTINSLLTIISLGILWPMARARKWRYIANCIGIVPGSQLAELEGASDEQAISALGEEGVDFYGFDFDAGVI